MKRETFVVILLAFVMLQVGIATGCVLVKAEGAEGAAREDKEETEKKVEEVVRVRRFELVNENGTAVLVMNTDDEGNPSVELFSSKGDITRLKLGVDSDGVSSVQVHDKKGDLKAIVFSGYAGQDGFNVLTSDGAVLAELWGSDKDSGLALRDTSGVKRIGAGWLKDKDSAGLVLCDKAAGTRLYGLVGAEGKATLALLKEKDEAAYKWTSQDK